MKHRPWFGVKLLHHPMPGPGKPQMLSMPQGSAIRSCPRPVTQVWTCSRYTRSFAHVQVHPFQFFWSPPYSSVWQEHSPTRSALDSQNGWCQVGTGIAHSSPKASPPGPILTGPKFWFPSYDTSYDVGSSDPAYPSMASQSSSWAQQVEERPRQPVTHIFESFPSKSKSKRRRVRHLKCVREPLPQILAISPAVRDDRFVGSELARADEWHALQQALLLVLEDPDQVQRAVALVESLFQREDQGSLGWWICQEVFHLSTHFDVTLILLILRGLETLRKSKPCGRRILQITSCNITTWRSEVKQWMATQEDVILVQEHHLLAPALSVEIEAMGAIGYDSLPDASIPRSRITQQLPRRRRYSCQDSFGR